MRECHRNGGPTNLGIFIHLQLPVQIEGIFATKASVLGVEVAQLDVGWSHVGHDTALGVETACDARMEDCRDETEAQGDGDEGKQADCPGTARARAAQDALGVWDLVDIVRVLVAFGSHGRHDGGIEWQGEGRLVYRNALGRRGFPGEVTRSTAPSRWPEVDAGPAAIGGPRWLAVVVGRAPRGLGRGGLGGGDGIDTERVVGDGGDGTDRQRILAIATVVRAGGPPLHSHDGRGGGALLPSAAVSMAMIVGGGGVGGGGRAGVVGGKG